MSDIVRIVMLMYPEYPPEEPMPGNLIHALEASPVFAPTQWGTSENVRQPYSKEAILNVSGDGKSQSRVVYLHRDKAVKYTGYFDFKGLPFLKLDFKGSFPKTRWADLLNLSDGIAAAVKSRFGTLQIYRPTPVRWMTDNDRCVRWMTLGSNSVPVLFQPNGPLGLGMRTYFGHDILEMFGRDVLLSTPGLTQSLDWGGIRIDLAKDMFEIPQTELAEIWKRAMDHLASSDAFAHPVFESDERTVSFRASQKWLDRR